MRTKTIVKNIYTWKELTEKQKEKAIEKLYYINVDHEWWDFTYEDAENIGLKITEFDLDRGSCVKGTFTQNALQVANSILKDRGCDCETAKTAQVYLNEYNALVAAQCQKEADFLCIWDHSEYTMEEIMEYCPEEIYTEEIDEDFLKSLCEDYRIILQHEYEYLTSEAVIIETIEANEYEFDEEGNISRDH